MRCAKCGRSLWWRTLLKDTVVCPGCGRYHVADSLDQSSRELIIALGGLTVALAILIIIALPLIFP